MTDVLLDLLVAKYIEEGFAGNYDQQDLLNSLIILQQILNSIAWNSFEEQGVPLTERNRKSMEFGIALRKAVIDFSGIDPNDYDTVTVPLQIITM